MSKIIVLNGCGSRGKTSIARAIQHESPDLWLSFGVDTFIDMIPLGRQEPYLKFIPGQIFILLLNTIKHKEKSLLKKIASVVTTPLIIMPIIGILLNYLKVALPTPIVDAISQIGSSASGLALFAFGLTLGATKITAQCLKFDLLSVVLIKSLAHPFVAICIAYFMKLENYWFSSLVIAASAPTAFVVYLISKQFSTEEELVKKVIALSSVVATISLVLITMIIR